MGLKTFVCTEKEGKKELTKHHTTNVQLIINKKHGLLNDHY